MDVLVSHQQVPHPKQSPLGEAGLLLVSEQSSKIQGLTPSKQSLLLSFAIFC